jgi:hypothetical protein
MIRARHCCVITIPVQYASSGFSVQSHATISSGKISHSGRIGVNSPISKCYHVETIASTGNVLSGTELE